MILLVIGLVLLLVELTLPGFGVSGVTGFILVIVSSIVTIIYLPFGIFIVLGELALIAFICFILFRYLRSKQLYGKLILDETLNEEKKEIGKPEFLLGKEGITKTPLRPHGEADFNGLVIDVYSSGQYIPVSRSIKVISVDDQKIIVKEIQ